MRLEADFRGDYDKTIGRFALELLPVGTLPSPFNAGQVVKFRTTQATLREPPFNKDREWGLSDLPEERVSIVVYGSGGREVKRVTADKFAPQFWDFDSVRKGERERKWDRYESKWRRYLGVNFFNRRIRRPIRVWREKRYHEGTDERFVQRVKKAAKAKEKEAKKAQAQ